MALRPADPRVAAAGFSGRAALLVFLETDCPTCRLTAPYLNRLAQALGEDSTRLVGLSQDGAVPTRDFIEQLAVRFRLEVDAGLVLSRAYDPVAVPAFFLLDAAGAVVESRIGFDKAALNELAAKLGEALGRVLPPIADPYDGAPASKPGCMSRHREPPAEAAPPHDLLSSRPARAARVALADGVDPWEYASEHFGDPLPVVPPTEDRVARMLAATPVPAGEVVAHVPPCYGAATVEKIAANAVMAGCEPAMMRVLIPLIRAACDERFNLHGVQATTHFAAPLVIVNGPVRGELGFACASNVFSNVARANSTLGRALQLILANLGGARPGEIDMSALGNPGKFSYCIAENEEENPWEPLHVERGIRRGLSALTLFAAEPPRGVSEHTGRRGAQVLDAISRALATVWSYRVCLAPEAVVVLCPEHVKTLHRDGFSKAGVRQFLFENTGIPTRHYKDDGAEGSLARGSYKEILIEGEPCYQKFRAPEAIQIVVAGGTAGKFSAVIGSWATGPRGSQMVTYPI